MWNILQKHQESAVLTIPACFSGYMPFCPRVEQEYPGINLRHRNNPGEKTRTSGVSPMVWSKVSELSVTGGEKVYLSSASPRQECQEC